MKVKTLKVGYHYPNGKSKPVPQIRFNGMQLERVGFKVGTQFIMVLSENLITLEVKDS